MKVIAGILNRQERKTAAGERFTANHVGNLRRYRNIPRFQPPTDYPPVRQKKKNCPASNSTAAIPSRHR
jgi:hypothetical protein